MKYPELLELIVLLDLLELKTTSMGWVGGWLTIFAIIRLSQPSLAGVGAGAQLDILQLSVGLRPEWSLKLD